MLTERNFGKNATINFEFYKFEIPGSFASSSFMKCFISNLSYAYKSILCWKMFWLPHRKNEYAFSKRSLELNFLVFICTAAHKIKLWCDISWKQNLQTHAYLPTNFATQTGHQEINMYSQFNYRSTNLRVIILKRSFVMQFVFQCERLLNVFVMMQYFKIPMLPTVSFVLRYYLKGVLLCLSLYVFFISRNYFI